MRQGNLAGLTLAAAISLVSAPVGWAATLTADAVWTGVVNLEEDLLIPRGVTLTVEAGTKVLVYHSETTKTEPQFWNPDTELAVEGKLIVKGTPGARVSFAPEGASWGGIVVATGGEARISGADLDGAEEALLVKDGEVELKGVEISRAERGIILAPGARFSALESRVRECQVGVIDLAGKGVPPGLRIENSRDAGVLTAPRTSSPPSVPPPAELKPSAGTREFVGEYTVEGEEEWKGTVVIDGRVTVPPGSTLKIAPGAKVLFRRRDTNGDGLGEGELLILGSVRCLGTAKEPVLFDSAESPARPGDWDKVSIISSEDAANRFEHAVFRHGLLALHAHFSTFAASHCLFEANYRGVQFQESESASVTDSIFRGNKQALRFRDSKATVKKCLIEANGYALHAYRCELEFVGNTVRGTELGGILIKESRATLRENLFEENLSPLKQKGAGSTLTLEGNRFRNAVETVLSLSEVSARITKNLFDGAGLDLVGLEGGEVVLRGNEFGASARDAVHLKSSTGADARCNSWNTDTPEARIHDRGDDPSLGVLLVKGSCE